LPPEFPKAYIGDGLGQMMVLQHAHYVQVFNHHDCLGFRQPARELMQRVGALVGHSAMESSELLACLAAVVAALASA
jgi:hypothetical protein